jgi:Family of unknown function (DUF5989)
VPSRLLKIELNMQQPNTDEQNERLLQQARNPGFLAGFLDFLITSRKWWMLPLLVTLLLLGLVLVLANTAAAPFIYTLF